MRRAEQRVPVEGLTEMLNDTTLTTNFLQIMQILAIVGSVIYVLSRTIESNKTNTRALEQATKNSADANKAIVERITGVELELRELSKVVVSNARLDERLTAALLRITSLEARRTYERAEIRYELEQRRLTKETPPEE